jgi:hypothetical protein
MAREGRQTPEEQHANCRLQHIPLWSVLEWGWGTDDSARALHLKRFGSVSVLNGHIHQVMQKVEGHVTFHTAMSTAFRSPRRARPHRRGR